MGYERQMSARQKALDLQKKKEAIEAEMDAIYDSLTKNGGPGMSGNLVDSEGFPRADIDVHGVRIQRNRFATLRTDHKMVVAEMEKLMHIALAPPANRDESEASPSSSAPHTSSAVPSASSQPSAEPSVPATSAPSTSSQLQAGPSVPPAPASSPPIVAANGGPPPRRRVPFALVDIVTPGSPAATADLHIQDKVVSFGGVSLAAFVTPSMAMNALPGLLREHENRALEVIVERPAEGPQQNLVTLSLTPRRWSGQGLLGCHVVPLQVSQEDDRYRPDVATATQRHSDTTFNRV